MLNHTTRAVAAVVTSLLFASSSPQAVAQDGWEEEEEVVIHLKKIRDQDSNYLSDITKATARAVSKSGEFKAVPHKRSASGPVIEVSPPTFSYAPYEEGLSTKEMASAGLSLVSGVGGLFGFADESKKVDEMNARLNEENAFLDAWDDNEQVMVTLTSRVVLLDENQGVEISRAINVEKVFDSKQAFLAQKNSLIEDAVVSEVKKVLVEYIEDDGGF